MHRRDGEESGSVERNEFVAFMGFGALLWQAIGFVCFVGQVIMILERHREVMVFLKQKLWPLPRENEDVIVPAVLGLFGVGALVAGASYLATSGFFAWVVGLPSHVSPTFAASSLMAVFFFGVGWFLITQTKFGTTVTEKIGSTKEKQYRAGLFVLMVFIDLFSGPFVTIVVSLLVVFFCYTEYESCSKLGSDLKRDWTPQVKFDNFLGLMCVYNLFSGLFDLLVAILSYCGLLSATCVTLVTALLLVSKHRKHRRLYGLDVFRAAVISTFIYVIWKLLVALLVAIHLYGWLSSERFSRLILASLMAADMLGLLDLGAMMDAVSSLLE